MKSGVSMRIFPPGIQLIWPRRCKGTWAVFGLEVSVAGDLLAVAQSPRSGLRGERLAWKAHCILDSGLEIGQRPSGADVTSRSALATRRGQVIEA